MPLSLSPSFLRRRRAGCGSSSPAPVIARAACRNKSWIAPAIVRFLLRPAVSLTAKVLALSFALPFVLVLAPEIGFARRRCAIALIEAQILLLVGGLLRVHPLSNSASWSGSDAA